MSDEMLQELDLLMARDETGMNVVMIDNREQLEAIHRQYPGLAKRFECIGEAPGAPASDAEKPAAPAPAPKAAPVPKVVAAEPKATAAKSGRPGENAVCGAKGPGTQSSRTARRGKGACASQGGKTGACVRGRV